jgi:hypothetical protein
VTDYTKPKALGTRASTTTPGKQSTPEERTQGLCHDELWIDHLEGECAPALAADLNLLLANSSSDRRVHKSLQDTRALVKKSDDVALPESGEFYDRMHAQIMMAIAELPAEEDPRLQMPTARDEFFVTGVSSKSRLSAGSLSPAFSGLMLFAVLISAGLMSMPHFKSVAAFQTLSQPLDSSSAVDRDLASNAEPQLIASSMLGFQNEGDLVTDALEHKLDRLSSRQIDDLFHSLRR